MIGTITPLVQEARSNVAVRVLLHLVGTALGGVLLGCMLAVIGTAFGPLPSSWVLAALVAVGSLAVLWQLGLIRMPLPEHRWSVPRGIWLQWDRRAASLLYGLAMGFGLLTHIRFASFHVLVVWIVLSADLGLAVLVAGTYGFARGLGVLFVTPLVARASSPGDGAHSVQRWLIVNSGQLGTLNAAASVGALVVWLAAY